MSRSRTVDLRWNALLNDFRRSGLTQAEFCRRRQISLHSFRKHLYGVRPVKYIYKAANGCGIMFGAPS